MPPAVLHRSVGAGPPLPPMVARPEIAELHAAWGRAHDSTAPPLPPGTGLRQRLGRRAKAWITEVAGGSGGDRELIGTLIRAVDALAKRSDELSGRVADLQAALEEAFEVLSEDVTRALSALASLPAGPTPPGPVGEDDGSGPATAGADPHAGA